MAPPTRRQVAGAPRTVPRAACAPRRPRLPVSWLLAVAGVVCLAVVGLGTLSGAGPASVPDRTAVVRVEPGESLWELAGRVAPGSDTTAVVERIRDLNGGLGDGVTPGQPLTVPSG
ncbi:MAG: LysM peptidoglycan-binding domain-containing protein [Actinophytocola sp.]|uniref:LysM peptidoglycan-binding domain-containing protein n=1 Tax=Actinophytocola sp. TaxID=1872138 RepID=UPI003D6B8D1C